MKAIRFLSLFFGLIYNLSVSSQNKTPIKEQQSNPNSNIAAKDDIGGGAIVLPPIADRVTFLYDESGNQKQRILCINCWTNRIADPNTIEEKLDLEKIIEDKLVFYPNPVKEELHIDFDNTDISKKVEVVTLYSIAGQLIKSYSNSANFNTMIIPFDSLPQGVYIVNVLYNTGEVIDLKIKKQ